MQVYRPAMDSMTCSCCGAEGLVPGTLEDQGKGAFTRNIHWVADASVAAGVTRAAPPVRRIRVEAFWCAECGHVDLFGPVADQHPDRAVV
jgi:transposase